MLTVEFSLPLVQVYTPSLSELILIMLRAISLITVLVEFLSHDTSLLLLDTQGNDTLVLTSTVRLEGGVRRN